MGGHESVSLNGTGNRADSPRRGMPLNPAAGLASRSGELARHRQNYQKAVRQTVNDNFHSVISELLEAKRNRQITDEAFVGGVEIMLAAFVKSEISSYIEDHLESAFLSHRNPD